jgi:hypothetical protein
MIAIVSREPDSVSASDLIGTEPALQTASAPPPQRPAAGDGPNWQEQDGVLREMWMHNQSPAAIAKALDRSVPAIMTRAARLGLPRRFAPGRKPGRRPAETESGTRSETSRSTAAAIAEPVVQVSTRVCLMCLGQFQSMGRHNRICPTCKSSAEYESGSRLPDFDFPVGDV